MCLSLTACQQDMATQPSVRPDEASAFFPDGRGNRPLVKGTIARGHLRTDTHLFTGKRGADLTAARDAAALFAAAGNPLNGLALANYPFLEGTDEVDTFPFPVTLDVLKHGKNRYMIYCVVCHDPLGTGHGIVVERGYTEPPSYHVERLRKAPVGHFFDVITNGYGSMPMYRQQIPPRDRWAIAAYIRVLQLSQHIPAGELPADMKAEWDKAKAKQAEGGKAP